MLCRAVLCCAVLCHSVPCHIVGVFASVHACVGVLVRAWLGLCVRVRVCVWHLEKFLSYPHPFPHPLSLIPQRPEKYLGEVATWERAEAALAKALDEFGRPWQVSAQWALPTTGGVSVVAETLSQAQL